MTRSAAAAALLAGMSLTLAGATHAKTFAAVGCAPAGGMSSVKRPQFVRNIPTGETGWFASPSLVDLNGDGKLEIVAPFYSTFVFDAKGHLLGKGTASKGRDLRTRRRRRPRWRQDPRHRRRRQRGHGRRLRARWREAAAQTRLAGIDMQRRPVPGGSRYGSGRPRRRRPHRGRRHDDQHLGDRVPGVRLRRERPTLAPEGSSGDLVAALQPTDRRRKRRRVQRHRQPRVRRLRRERGDREPRRRPAARDRRHLRQPPDQRLQR